MITQVCGSFRQTKDVQSRLDTFDGLLNRVRPNKYADSRR